MRGPGALAVGGREGETESSFGQPDYEYAFWFAARFPAGATAPACGRAERHCLVSDSVQSLSRSLASMLMLLARFKMMLQPSPQGDEHWM